MNTHPIQLTDVLYNAADQCFEALVTVYDGNVTRKFACAIDAPITMSFEDAAAGLSRQAIRRLAHRGGMYSQQRASSPTTRAGRPRFDPVRWLESILSQPGKRAA